MSLSPRGYGIPISSEDQDGWHTIKWALPLPLRCSFSYFLLPHGSDSSQHCYEAFVWVFPVAVSQLCIGPYELSTILPPRPLHMVIHAINL